MNRVMPHSFSLSNVYRRFSAITVGIIRGLFRFMNSGLRLWSDQLPLNISGDFRETAKAESRKRLISVLFDLPDYAKGKENLPSVYQ